MTTAILIIMFVTNTGATSQSIPFNRMSECLDAGKHISQDFMANNKNKINKIYTVYSCVPNPQ